MFTLSLTEIEDAKPLAGSEGIEFVGGAMFEHFRHNFRELPADKIQQIMAIITKPPRAPRKDKGTTKKKPADTQTQPLI